MDPAVPVPRWSLTDFGLRRMRALAATFDAAPPLAAPPAAAPSAAAPFVAIWASTETKAIEGAGILAARFGLPVQVLASLGENDRSSTGYLPREAFEVMADAFFARPRESIRGWERAADAQARIVAAVAAVLAESPPGDVAVVAHGAVGALLRCHLAGAPISRAWDQPGPGHRFVVPRALFPGPGIATEWIALPPG